MTTDNRTNEPTPNPTAEQIVADAMWSSWSDAEENTHSPAAIVAAPRAHDLLSEGAPSDAQVLAALNAYSDAGLVIDGYEPADPYENLHQWGERSTAQMRAALSAAGVTPQEPRQNETKSGQDFVSLDAEKVAAMIDPSAFDPEYSRVLRPDERKRRRASALMRAHALCEAAKRGELSA